MRIFPFLLLQLAASFLNASELNFKYDTPVSYNVVYAQTLSGSVGSEKIQDTWKYELDFDLSQKKTIDQGACVDVTLKRFACTVENGKTLRASYDSANPSKTSPFELNDILDSALFLHFPSRYERTKNGRIRGEKNNYPFQQYLKDLSDKAPSGPIKEIMQATHNFWFLDEKCNLLALLTSILNDQLIPHGKGCQQVLALQSTSLFHMFPLHKWPLLSSFEKALTLRPASCLLFVSDASTAEIAGSWDEGFLLTTRDCNGATLKENGNCKGTVKWNKANALIQDREWTWENDVCDPQNSQSCMKFTIKQTIKSKEIPKK